MTLYLCLLLGLASGLLIGIAGIGGVILVPLLVFLAKVDIHTSIAASVAAFFVSGCIGTIAYSKRGIIQWSDFVAISMGAIPGAVLGALFLPKIDAFFLLLFIAIVLMISSARQLVINENNKLSCPARKISNYRLVFVGLVTGFLSVLSGTGGPLILLPLLTWLSVPLVTAIGLSQAIQLPISSFATIGNALSSLIDWKLVIFLAVGIAFGSIIGTKAAERLPVAYIKTLVAVLLLGSGIYMTLVVLFA